MPGSLRSSWQRGGIVLGIQDKSSPIHTLEILQICQGSLLNVSTEVFCRTNLPWMTSKSWRFLGPICVLHAASARQFGDGEIMALG